MDSVLKKQGLPSYKKLKVALDWAKDSDLVDAMKRDVGGKKKCTEIKQEMEEIIKYWKQRIELLEMATTALRVEEA
ncbi:uncharacterized protein PG986_012032 [Apiospora aurea]|uniref:Uncharacterized protein n=1 Tax=Apiospora aurea TaxID=335848 RepID=A0ABR1PYU0_9PEZI